MSINYLRVLCYLIGLTILSFGVTLTIKSEIGTGAWDALNVGLSQLLFTVGTWVVVIGIILIIINSILLMQRPDFYALITVLIVGVGVDSWLLLLHSVDLQTMIPKYICFFIGLFLLSFGISIYLQAEFAPVPIDNLMIAIHTRFKVRLGVAKTIGELLALTFAILFKGPIGIGTILVTILIGPLVNLLHPRMKRLVERFQ